MTAPRFPLCAAAGLPLVARTDYDYVRADMVEANLARLVEELRRYVRTIDSLYKHNAASSQAVVKAFGGTTHSPLVLALIAPVEAEPQFELQRECPKCMSENVSTERRPDGDSVCADCGFKAQTKYFDRYRLAAKGGR